MGKKGRLKPKHRRDGQRRIGAGRDRPKPVIASADFQPPAAWLAGSEDPETSDRACEERASAT